MNDRETGGNQPTVVETILDQTVVCIVAARNGEMREGCENISIEVVDVNRDGVHDVLVQVSASVIASRPANEE